MTSNVITILLVAESEKHREAYLAAIDRPGVTVVTCAAFDQLPADAVDQPFHGVLVDLPTKIRALKNHRDFVYRILDRFPLAQLSRDRRTGKVNVFYHGQENSRTLEDFLYNRCRSATPRLFRRHHRKKVHFHVYATGIGTDTTRSTTINLSKSGCFIYTVDTCPVGSSLTVSFTAAEGQRPVGAIVRHTVTWGTPQRLCGLGLEFAGNPA